MSLRSLGYLVTRRSYPRNIYRVQAASVSAAGRPGRSLHTLRDLGAGNNAFGALVAASMAAGGVGIFLILKKHPDDKGSNVTNEDTKETSRKPEVTESKPMQVEVVTDMDKPDVIVEARFREWMKREGKVYPNQEEERKRFEVFKKSVEKMDALYKNSSVRPTEGPWADMTYEELLEMRGFNKRVNHDRRLEEEKALNRMLKERAQKMVEEGKFKNYNHSLLGTKDDGRREAPKP